MKTDLSGRVAFVTGAASGIGRAIAGRFAECGAAIAVADIDGAGAERAAASCRAPLRWQVDIREQAAIERGVEQTLAAFGRLDILVNNAGVNTLAHRVDIDAFPVEEWHRIVGIDLDGTYLVSRTAVQPMLRQGSGRIINIASTVGLAAMRLQSPFVAAKAGIIHLTRSMALELAPKGILVNAIAPGSTLTEVTREALLRRGRVVPRAGRGIHAARAARPPGLAATRSPRERCSWRRRRAPTSTAIAWRSTAAGPPAT